MDLEVMFVKNFKIDGVKKLFPRKIKKLAEASFFPRTVGSSEEDDLNKS